MAQDVRFSPAQRDALIDMAARIQAERETSVGMDELAQAAREAGIDPRYLGEAALRLEEPPLDARGPLMALAGLALFDALFMGVVLRSWFFPVAGPLRLLLLAGAAALFARSFARHPALRGVAPLAPVAVWAALGVMGALAYRLHGGYYSGWAMPLAFAATCALVQAVVAGLVAWFAARRR